MPYTQCCVPMCTQRGGHVFPKDKDRFKTWLVAIRRDKWKPSKHSVVCSQHFSKDDYMQKTTYGTIHCQKRLKTTAVPHTFQWSKLPSQMSIQRAERTLRQEACKEEHEAAATTNENSGEEILLFDDLNIACEETVDAMASEDDDSSCTEDFSTQTETTEMVDATTQCRKQPIFSVRHFINDEDRIAFYTGLDSYKTFKFVLHSLGPAAYHLIYYKGFVPDMDVEEQFFITLVKLRLHRTNFEIAGWYGMKEDGVTSIFVTWINYMYHQWNEINWWPSRDLINFYAPTNMKHAYPTTRVIIDGTECPIMKPKQPLAQQATFSTYKNRNTVKVLVGCTPGGLVSYISEAYGGSTSDRQICEKSNLKSLCEEGDSIMADKGFNVQDLFVKPQVLINIPSFFKAKNRMSGETVLKDKKIVSKRVHIERIIGLAKTYKILCRPLNNTESALATEIITVCFRLCAFRKCIVPRHA